MDKKRRPSTGDGLNRASGLRSASHGIGRSHSGPRLSLAWGPGRRYGWPGRADPSRAAGPFKAERCYFCRLHWEKRVAERCGGLKEWRAPRRIPLEVLGPDSRGVYFSRGIVSDELGPNYELHPAPGPGPGFSGDRRREAAEDYPPALHDLPKGRLNGPIQIFY